MDASVEGPHCGLVPLGASEHLVASAQLQALLAGQDYHMMETEIEALLIKAKAEARLRERKRCANEVVKPTHLALILGALTLANAKPRL